MAGAIGRTDGREAGPVRAADDAAAHPEVNDALAGAVALFKALAAATRLAVITELSAGPRCVHELGEALQARGRHVSQPLLSQHLKVLRAAGLVSTTRRATEITYRLVDRHVAHIVNDAIQHSQENRS